MVHVYAIEDAVLTAAKFASNFWSSLQGYVWNATTRIITGGSLTNPDDYKADVSSLATQSNISSLQTHGDSNWATATGFATPSDVSTSESNIISHGDSYWNTSSLTSSDIYTYFTTGTNEDVFKADVSNLLTTSRFDTNISQLRSEHSSIQSDLDNPDQYKADISSLATSSDVTNAKNDIINHGDLYWNTSSLTAADIWSYATRTLSDYSGVWSVDSRTLTAFSFAIDLSSEALSNLADSVWDEAQSGHTTSGTFGYYLDSQISSIEAANNTAIADAVWSLTLYDSYTANETQVDLHRQLIEGW